MRVCGLVWIIELFFFGRGGKSISKFGRLPEVQRPVVTMQSNGFTFTTRRHLYKSGGCLCKIAISPSLRPQPPSTPSRFPVYSMLSSLS